MEGGSERGQASHKQGEEKRHYWSVGEDIEVKTGPGEGETGESKI